jgi:dTDP-4-amino-4,6-dideoxygalactose transaminase
MNPQPDRAPFTQNLGPDLPVYDDAGADEVGADDMDTSLPHAERAAAEVLSLPTGSHADDSVQKHVAEALTYWMI